VTPPRYIALLRAINVGGRTVRMEQLRTLFEAMGFDAVETFIASGNVIFQARGRAAVLQQAIEASLERDLGFAVGAFLRTPAELADAIAASPFTADGPGALYVGFGARRFAPAAAARMKLLQTDADTFAVAGCHVYWRALNGMGQSKVTGAAVEKALGAPVTFRSITTVWKLALKYGGQS
jgi:uncharacterized protein (DUF1697 family)